MAKFESSNAPPLGADESRKRLGAGTQRRRGRDQRSACADALALKIEEVAGSPVVSSEPVRGGDFATAVRCDLASGRIIFTKTHTNPPPQFFSTEATSLEWLRARGALVPQVLAFSDEEPAHLTLDWIQPGRSTREGDADFGRMLARMHRLPFDCFGRPDSRTTGSHKLPNQPAASWVEHFATNRLLPLAALANDTGQLEPKTCRDIEAVANNLEKLGGPSEPASLLHGDLWAGNRIVDSQARSWMIDPAACGGHREFDLAMMRLFGGYGPDCFGAYNEQFPLSEGWRDRVLLHQLAPLAVHALKFGAHYVGALDEALASLGQ